MNEPFDTTDRRTLAEMPFGVEAGKGLEGEERKNAQEAEAAWVRGVLTFCLCTTADDINRLGCTGVAKFAPTGGDTIVDVIERLRLGLAGGGVGLPCFVPPTRFCLGHNTIGGLEDKQKAYHTEFVNAISRELTPEEEVKIAAMDRVRHMKRPDAEEFIAGRSAAEAEEAVRDGASADGLEHQEAVQPIAVLAPQQWKCDEHATTNWSCRHCVAQAVVEGSLEPGYMVAQHDVPQTSYAISASDMEKTLQDWDKNGVNKARVYVCVATFTRKLSRD